MCVHFEEATTQLCNTQIDSLMAAYVANNSDWQSKDTAIYLFIALAVKSETKAQGVITTNPHVNLIDFFQRHVLADLQTVTVTLANLLTIHIPSASSPPARSPILPFPRPPSIPPTRITADRAGAHEADGM